MIFITVTARVTDAEYSITKVCRMNCPFLHARRFGEGLAKPVPSPLPHTFVGQKGRNKSTGTNVHGFKKSLWQCGKRIWLFERLAESDRKLFL